jgi:hypothetical protein
MLLGIVVGLVIGITVTLIGVSNGVSKAERLAKTKEPEKIEANCGCRHHFVYHDPNTGACKVVIPKGSYIYYEGESNRYTASQEKCQCMRYAGPEPLNEFYAIEQATI